MAAVVVVVIFLAAYQEVENHILQPVILSRTVKLNPLTVVIAFVAGFELAGILGALLAIPVAGCVAGRGPRPVGATAVVRWSPTTSVAVESWWTATKSRSTSRSEPRRQWHRPGRHGCDADLAAHPTRSRSTEGLP